MDLLEKITVVDARMGRGKTSAAIRYMKENKNNERFLYITPFLSEVDRVCEACDFDQPGNDYTSKSTELKSRLASGKNLVASHSLFYLMDDEALHIIKDQGYTLFVDESIEVVEKMPVTISDFKLITSTMTHSDENGALRWNDETYTGKFFGYKEAADIGSLFQLDNALLNIMNPELLRSFKKVFMLTYLFKGQYQSAYLDYFGFDYEVIGIDKGSDGYRFSDKPDNPDPINYWSFITIEDSDKMNRPGNGKYSLSHNWFEARGYDNPDVKRLRSSMNSFFRRNQAGNSDTRLWTCFKDEQWKLIQSSGRYRGSFLQLGARATNEYKGTTDIAYMVNRFADPNIVKFFATNGIVIDQELYALSEMLQWIWRSAIRDCKPINIYIPSKRMRSLLIDWINSVGGDN